MSQITGSKPIWFSGRASTSAVREGREILHKGKITKVPLTGDEIGRSLKDDSNDYLGSVPSLFNEETTSLKPNEFMSKMDELSQNLRKPKGILDSILSFRLINLFLFTKPEKVQLGSQSFDVKPISQGYYGWVYLIEGQGKEGQRKRYALKLYKDKIYEQGKGLKNTKMHSAAQEGASGLFFTANDVTKDCVKSFTANPNQGWSLSEFILDSRWLPKRKGFKLKEWGDGAIRVDDDYPDNKIQGVRVDLGGVVGIDVKPY